MGNTLRQKFGIDAIDGDEGGARTFVLGAVVGTAAVGLAFFAWSKSQHKDTLTIDATVVADQLELPASLNVVSVFGGSSTTSVIDMNMGLGVGPFSHDFSIGSIPFETTVSGENSIEYKILKDSSADSQKANQTPNSNNQDKYMRVSVEKDGERDVLVIDADIAGFSANTKNMQTLKNEVSAEGAIDLFRSLPPEIASQIATGSEKFNVENFRLSCAKEITSQDGVLEAGIAKAVAVNFQLSAPAILEVLKSKYPENPEVLDQAERYIAELTKPENIRVRFTEDPNNPASKHVSQNKKNIGYMQAANLTGVYMSQAIGLKSEEMQSINLSDDSSKCTLSDSVKSDIQKIIATWHEQTPYDDAQIAKLEGKE